MNRKIVLIGGYLASGKSTFARQLSKALAVPYLMKDTFKSALCQNVPISSQEESSRYSIVTFDAMMYAAERLLEVGYPMILEGNFVPAGIKKCDEAGVIRGLIDQYAYQPLTFQFTGDTQVLYDRFIEREKSTERGQANTMFQTPSKSDFDRFCRNLDGFDVGGKVVTVDTTDFSAIDFAELIETARLFLD